jgi:hypothetical protein
MSDRYVSVSLTREQGITRMFAAAAAVKGTLADVDQDGDIDADDIDVLDQPIRELQRIPCYYELGAGGRDANTPYPWNESLQCDCSAAVGHWIGKPRGNGDWGTTKILSDAYEVCARSTASSGATASRPGTSRWSRGSSPGSCARTSPPGTGRRSR